MWNSGADVKLISMKLDAAAQQARYAEPSAVSPDRPAYPWGLELRLEKDALTKLGLADALPDAGATLMLHAKVSVTNVSESDSADGGKNCSLTLQITDLGLAPAKDEKPASETLYGKGT